MGQGIVGCTQLDRDVSVFCREEAGQIGKDLQLLDEALGLFPEGSGS